MIQNTRIALAPYQAEYQFLTSNDAFTVFGMIHQDQIHFRFFYKKLLVGRDGIYSLFESYSENPKPFWWSPFGFLLWRKVSFESFTFDLRFFPIHRSKKYRTNCSSDPFWILRSSLAFGIQEIILLWKSDFGIQRQVPSCQIWPGSSITMMVLLSFLSSLRLFLLTLTGCLEFLDLGFVFLGVSIIYHTLGPLSTPYC